jgi:hypothetical protein
MSFLFYVRHVAVLEMLFAKSDALFADQDSKQPDEGDERRRRRPNAQKSVENADQQADAQRDQVSCQGLLLV